MDFVRDQLATGRKLRVLTIIDTFSRFSLAIEPPFKVRGPDVVEILEEVDRQVGFPKATRVDQGTDSSPEVAGKRPAGRLRMVWIANGRHAAGPRDSLKAERK
jgi:hypothetical protein